MATWIFYVAVFVAGIFWLIQVMDLFMRDERDFESHTHKLTWFLVLVTGSLVAAIWYSIWKKQVTATRSQTEP